MKIKCLACENKLSKFYQIPFIDKKTNQTVFIKMIEKQYSQYLELLKDINSMSDTYLKNATIELNNEGYQIKWNA